MYSSTHFIVRRHRLLGPLGSTEYAERCLIQLMAKQSARQSLTFLRQQRSIGTDLKVVMSILGLNFTVAKDLAKLCLCRHQLNSHYLTLDQASEP